MASIRVERWKRFGHDRLYVYDGTGPKLGYVNLRTGQTVREPTIEWPAEADTAVRNWCRRSDINQPLRSDPGPQTQDTTNDISPPPTSATIPVPARDQPRRSAINDPKTWTDLAKNRPGAAVKAAVQERATWSSRLGRLVGVRGEDASWRSGLKGERKVARTLRLARLFGWRTLHSIPVGTRNADIDHVVIGPGGVVTINTKNHRGKTVKAGDQMVFVNGTPHRYAPASRYEGRRAAELLAAAAGQPIPVEPVVVIVGAQSLRNGEAGGVRILARAELPLWLFTRPRRLDRRQRRDFYQLARRSTTWQPTTSPPQKDPAAS